MAPSAFQEPAPARTQCAYAHPMRLRAPHPAQRAPNPARARELGADEHTDGPIRTQYQPAGRADAPSRTQSPPRAPTGCSTQHMRCCAHPIAAMRRHRVHRGPRRPSGCSSRSGSHRRSLLLTGPRAPRGL